MLLGRLNLLLFIGYYKLANDEPKLLIGIPLSRETIKKNEYESLEELELRVFSQYGDDWIILYLAHNLNLSNNTYIIRNDKMNNPVWGVSLDAGYVKSKYRELRDQSGKLTYAPSRQRVDIFRGPPVFDVGPG